ncbi:unnamed protein product, partial [Urochloa humidicola]
PPLSCHSFQNSPARARLKLSRWRRHGRRPCPRRRPSPGGHWPDGGLPLPALLTDAEIRAEAPWWALRRRHRPGVNLRQGCSSSPPPHPPAKLLLSEDYQISQGLLDLTGNHPTWLNLLVVLLGHGKNDGKLLG